MASQVFTIVQNQLSLIFDFVETQGSLRFLATFMSIRHAIKSSRRAAIYCKPYILPFFES